MKKYLIRKLGLKGSWSWAVCQMKKGKLVVRKSTTGGVKYRFSKDEQDRLEWDFHRKQYQQYWESANLFLSDMNSTDWIIYKWKE